MANTKYDSLLSHVLPEVQGCSDPLAEQAIKDAAIDFCQRSRVWIHVCDPADIDAGEVSYDLDLPAGAALVQVNEVYVGGQLLNPVDGYSAGGDEELVLKQSPDAHLLDGLQVSLIAKPSRSSTSFPAWINERYQDGIVAGAKAYLMRKQGTAWYNPQQAQSYADQFHTAWSSARGDTAGDMIGTPIRTTSYN